MSGRQTSRAWWPALALILVGLGAVASAGEIRYLAWRSADATALVQVGEGASWVAAGDSVPGFGIVADLDERRIIFERLLTDAERAELQNQGAIPHAVEQIEVLRRDLRFQGIGVSGGETP